MRVHHPLGQHRARRRRKDGGQYDVVRAQRCRGPTHPPFRRGRDLDLLGLNETRRPEEAAGWYSVGGWDPEEVPDVENPNLSAGREAFVLAQFGKNDVNWRERGFGGQRIGRTRSVFRGRLNQAKGHEAGGICIVSSHLNGPFLVGVGGAMPCRCLSYAPFELNPLGTVCSCRVNVESI